MGNHAVVETPVRPAALLSFILARCTHPTTLIVCSSSADFVQRCAHDDYYDGDGCTEPLHTASLLQVAVARHVRVAFVPTVAHLRSFLAAFNLAASRMPPPPVVVSSGSNSSNDNDPERLSVSRGDRALVVYDFVRLHKGTSEWSGQGLGASTAVLAEAGWRTGLDVLVVESGAPVTGETPDAKQETVLDTRAPVLSTAARKQLQRAGYPLRTERIKAVLSRWLTLRQQLAEESEATGKGEIANAESSVAAREIVPATERASQDGVEVPKVIREQPGEDTLEEATKEGAGTAASEGQGMGTSETVQARPQRTFVKDSEDEDEDLSDDEIYP